MGPYCEHCGRRCFVHRQIIIGDTEEPLWSGYMPTCQEGASRDRARLGQNHTTAHNPLRPTEEAEVW